MSEPSDDLLIELIRGKNEEAYNCLKRRYTPYIYKWISNYKALLKLNKIEIEDVSNVLLFHFDQILEEYDSHFGYWGSYLKLCLERVIFKLVKEANSSSNKALTNSFSLDANIKNLSDLTYLDSIESDYVINDYSNNVELKAKVSRLKEEIASFNEEEKKVLVLKYQGYSYQDISRSINQSKKKVDNYIYKIKKKLTKC